MTQSTLQHGLWSEIQRETYPLERNDCTVRAIRDAYAVSYEIAHEICARFGHKDGEGFFVQATVLPKLGLTLVESTINKRVSQLILDEKKTYLCLVMGHIFCLKGNVPVEANGNIDGWMKLFGAKKVIRLFEVK